MLKSSDRIKSLRFLAKLKEWNDLLLIPISAGAVYVSIRYFNPKESIPEKINALYTVAVFALIVIYIAIKMIFGSGRKRPVPDGIDSFFKSAFRRLEPLTSKQIRFTNDSELLNATVMIQNNPTFHDQFDRDYRPRLELYSNWNKLTNNKSVAQVFSDDGKELIGASIILPLNEYGYRKLINAATPSQLEVLTELTKDDLELVEYDHTYFLIDILIIDKASIKEWRLKKPGEEKKIKDYLSGISLHATLWHLATLSGRRISQLPHILVQPDVFGMLKWTHSDAGLVPPHDRQATADIGDYILINDQVHEHYRNKADERRLYVISQCLRILQAYSTSAN